jgi:undecaprenyl-diphosphatase
MDPWQAIAVAVLQGATELFPVSSLGHAVVVPALLGWQLDQDGPSFLPFLVLLHLGTALALLLFFWRDWWRLLRGVLGLAPAAETRAARRLFLLIVVATIPAVVVGAGLHALLKALFGSPAIAAFVLMLNGLLLIATERVRGRGGARDLRDMTVADALVIGIWQCGALVPGISRAGATMIGGLLRGLHHEGAAHFSFLIATPIIFGATVHEAPKLLHADIPPGVLPLAALAAVVAGIVAWLSTAFLMRYFRQNDLMALNPFGYYCLLFGAASLAWLLA